MLFRSSKKLCFTGMLVFAAIALSWGLSWAETKVVFIHGAEPKSLDNALHPAGSADLNVQTSLYDSLTYHRLDGTIEGRLATSWSYKNPTTLVFKLRKGVKFHDGTPFNAAAVKFSLDRTRTHKRARLRKWIAMIKEISVIDDHTVQLDLKYPFAPVLLNLSTPLAAIGSPAGIKKHGKNFRRNPVGTGPFIFVKWVAGEYIRFRANPDYWEGKPKIDVLEFRLVPEATTRVLQLRSGQAQLAMFLPPAQLGEVDKDPKLDLVKAPLFRVDRTRTHKRARLRKWIAMIKEIRVIDDHTVEIELKYPFAPVLLNLSTPLAAIGSPAGIKKHGKNFRRNPVGTGPFIFVKWVAGEYIRFRANPDYWEGKPKIDVLEFRLVPEATTRVLQLRSGQAQLAMFLPPAQLGEVDKDPKLDLVKAPLFRVIFIGMSMLHKPFDNPIVRQAMNYAIDTKTIIEKVMLGVGRPIRGPFGPTVWGYDPEFEKMGYRYDPKKAKELLKKAGYPNGFKTDFWHPTGRYTADKVAAEAIQAQLANVGIQARLRTGSWGLVAPSVRKGKAPMFLYGWGVSTGDPDMVMYNKFHSATHGRSGNYTRYKNPELEKIVDKARQVIDPVKRKAMYKEAAKLVIADPPWVFFKQEVMLVGKSKKLKGVIVHPGERLYWRNAYMEK